MVRALLRRQHPDLADLPLVEVAAGWDNAMLRLGDELAVRLPRRQAAAELILKEQRWLPLLAPSLPLATPVPLRIGRPSPDYPWSFSVTPWLDGESADRRPPAADQASALGGFLATLHKPAPDDAPRNPVRGVPLSERAEAMAPRIARLRAAGLFGDGHAAIWREALEAPLCIEPTWIHGDLHPRNVLVQEGRLSAVIDWGDLAVGDPATDLASLWMLFADPAVREEALRARQGVTAVTRKRARGWALLFAIVLADTGLVDHPEHLAIGKRVLHTLGGSPA
ncbi:hypothetical protein ABI59_15945 [Acidobacteria bacterium Mor1]|nr:hypothetical protein ABI59_15945 [Acidobacteria bacterium Mor1]